MNNATLLILAAGMGSRYQGQKQIEAVGSKGECIMEFTIFDALKLGIRKFVLIVNTQFPIEFKNKLIEISEKQHFEIHFITQTIDKFIPKSYLNKLDKRIKPLGTAHAVYCAKDLIDEPFITVNADDYYGNNSLEMAMQLLHNKQIDSNNFGIVAFMLQNTLSENGPVSRGICRIKPSIKRCRRVFQYFESWVIHYRGTNK